MKWIRVFLYFRARATFFGFAPDGIRRFVYYLDAQSWLRIKSKSKTYFLAVTWVVLAIKYGNFPQDKIIVIGLWFFRRLRSIIGYQILN